MADRRMAAVAAGAAGAAALVHAAPLVTSIPLLRGWWPTWSGLGRPGHLALTFDDGPDEASTPLFLERLAAAGVRATFFLLGEMAERHPDLPRRMVDEGHQIAVHSWDHRSHLLRPPGRWTSDQLERTADLLTTLTGVAPTLFRPPYGVLTGGDLLAARRWGLQPLLWSSWGRDWTATASPASVMRTINRGRLDGGTVLLHDSDCTSAPGAWRSAYGALPLLLRQCAEAGIAVGPVREHAPERAATSAPQHAAVPAPDRSR